MKRSVKILLGVITVVAVVAVVVLNPRLPEPEDGRSAELYQPGPLGVTREPIELTDTSRPTPANGEFEGRPERRLNGYVWYPETRDGGPFPLVVYSHGFMSSATGAAYLVDFLVPKGYVVVAVNYPLSHGAAPGGPTVTDVLNQAGDVSFVIDAMLARNEDSQDSLNGLLDPSRIAAAGLSLGGLTTELAAYHREARDSRISAAVSMAGPSAMLERRFFQTSDIPFMMIAGSLDAIVPYGPNAAPMPGKVDNSRLVTLERGSHAGFAGVSSTFLRWFDHPDELVCPMLLERLDGEGSQGEPILEPDPASGISTSDVLPCAMESFDRAMRPGEQQMLTRLALYAFLEQVFAGNAERRRTMERYLSTGFANENGSARVETSMRVLIQHQ